MFSPLRISGTPRMIWKATMLWLLAFSLACLVAAVSPMPALGITLGQVDDFHDGGLDAWIGGGGGLVGAQMNIPSGGPSGAGDNYLQLAAGGTGGAPRLLGVNQAQWTGDFSGASVGAIGMDLLNSSAAVLSIRVAIREGTGNSSTPGYVSTHAFPLPADNLWHHAVFLLDDADLTGVNSPAPLATDLASVAEFRLLDAANVSLQGDSFGSSSPPVAFGVDNITAVPTLLAGDFNRDGHRNIADLQSMMSVLADLSDYQAYWGLTSQQLTTLADFTSDESVTNQDLQGLIDKLANDPASPSTPVPEPSTWIVLTGASLAILPVVLSSRLGSSAGCHQSRQSRRQASAQWATAIRGSRCP
jgi:hypothetical protein